MDKHERHRVDEALARLNRVRRYCDEIRKAAADTLPAGIDEYEAVPSLWAASELATLEFELRDIADRLYRRGIYAPDAASECPL